MNPESQPPQSKISHIYPFLIMVGVIHTLVAFYDQGIGLTLIAKVKFLSCWGTELTMIYFIVRHFNLGSRGFQETLMCVVLCLQTMIIVFYWTAMHNVKPHFTQIFVFKLYTEHIYPFFFMVFEFFSNDLQTRPAHKKWLICMIVGYLVTNLAFGHFQKKPVYDIITWDNVFTFVFVGASMSFLWVAHWFWSKMSVRKMRAKSE